MLLSKPFLASLAFGLALLDASGADNRGPKLNVLQGPAKAALEGVGQIDFPAGYTFIDGKGTRELMKALGEPSSGPDSQHEGQT